MNATEVDVAVTEPSATEVRVRLDPSGERVTSVDVHTGTEIQIRRVQSSIAIPGPEGPQGEDGDPAFATPEQIEQAVADFMAEFPREKTLNSPGPVSEWTIDHGLPYEPNVTLTDSFGRELLVPIRHNFPTAGSLYIDIRPTVTSLTAVLS
jgi:hypothetical protein